MLIHGTEISSYLTTPFTFSGIQRIDRHCRPVTWTITIQLATPEADDVTPEEQAVSTNISYQKLLFWMETQLPDIIISSVSDDEADAIIAVSENTFMYCPGDPTDDMLIQLLHAKIQSILGDKIYVGDVTLCSTNSPATYTYNAVTPYRLPEVTDYILDPMHDKPWWFRPTMDTFDVSKPDEGDDIIEWPEDALVKFERSYFETLAAYTTGGTTADDEDAPVAEVVPISKYTRPTLVK